MRNDYWLLRIALFDLTRDHVTQVEHVIPLDHVTLHAYAVMKRTIQKNI